MKSQDSAACGVGFVASRHGRATHDIVARGLGALKRLEHRGGMAADRRSSDGAGVMTDIPFALFDAVQDQTAVAMLFLAPDARRRGQALDLFERTLDFLGLVIEGYREVPVHMEVLGPVARKAMPVIRQALIQRPNFCRTLDTFENLLYQARQKTAAKLREADLADALHFCSFSAKTIVYKALTDAADLAYFYPDLQHADFCSRFAMFHRRFSTNTSTTWDRAQPFRMLAHNGEINTIAGNRSWSLSREMSLGLPKGELFSSEGLSDSGTFNEGVEGLRFRSSIQRMDEIMGITMPPAHEQDPFYTFWSRAMEPWDGPALVAYSDGERIGARLDRNGFRPCRWLKTAENFYLASEAGVFQIPEHKVLSKGSVPAGGGIVLHLPSGEHTRQDPARRAETRGIVFDARLDPLEPMYAPPEPAHLRRTSLFGYTREDVDKILLPMILDGKEPIGSMGDTARLALLSDQPRSFFDFFFQDFAQVTNPPLDYLRERNVTDLAVHLGRRPNIFSPKELLPPPKAILLERPLLSLAEMARLDDMAKAGKREPIRCRALTFHWSRAAGSQGLTQRLETLAQEAVEAVQMGAELLILSDREADIDQPPIPSLLALRAVVQTLNSNGLRLRASVVVHSGEIRETHHVAALLGFGAAAVCPYLALEFARFDNRPKLARLEPDRREHQLLDAFTNGLLKIMAKMGISVVRAYQSAKLFTPLGLDQALVDRYFPKLNSPLGGVGLEQIAQTILDRTAAPQELPHTYQYKEQNRGERGEQHGMTSKLSKVVHRFARDHQTDLQGEAAPQETIVNLRHLLDFVTVDQPKSLAAVQSRADIMTTFGSGAMSFGAISAEAQRDIFLAMSQIGGRANSGEGGDNPYRHREGVGATTKQIASGRFGVTADYLSGAAEFQIKMAQGAKPGEGGQLMGVKVDVDIAKARHATPGVDLISPPPMHDIYSIEDLAQLIDELKQFQPDTRVSVKLVAGAGIGAIAVGVAKAGADVIHIAGGDGGTGAAALSSMKHAGLPWELGLVAAHRALTQEGFRDHVILRVDGGLQNARDILMAAILGAQEFDFGKFLLVAQGCIMARICEKNTCPTGIATHDPKFKAKYKGTPQDIVRVLTALAEQVRRGLADLGLIDLRHAVGRTDLLRTNSKATNLLTKHGLNLDFFLQSPTPLKEDVTKPLFAKPRNPLNRRILKEAWDEGRLAGQTTHLTYAIGNTDRGILTALASTITAHRLALPEEVRSIRDIQRDFTFTGSAGQGFAAFLTDGITATLWGEANDSVCKGMSGGRVTIRPGADAAFDPGANTLIGNAALYGATGGVLYVHGRAGDRFAVRNSGAKAVVEGAGLHACEYMTGGHVVILGSIHGNLGAGMTGGVIYWLAEEDDWERHINGEYVTATPLVADEHLQILLADYAEATGSTRARALLQDGPRRIIRVTPKGAVTVTPSQNMVVTTG